ncbi:hypothetical protein V5799_011659 [Amblyomma americanum]|uniref:Uncharacterized protein n=1 Tax=Amblyomma americanum TaxID=6943 RepID=A0AAQ4EG92_AMBAM
MDTTPNTVEYYTSPVHRCGVVAACLAVAFLSVLAIILLFTNMGIEYALPSGMIILILWIVVAWYDDKYRTRWFYEDISSEQVKQRTSWARYRDQGIV